MLPRHTSSSADVDMTSLDETATVTAIEPIQPADDAQHTNTAEQNTGATSLLESMHSPPSTSADNSGPPSLVAESESLPRKPDSAVTEETPIEDIRESSNSDDDEETEQEGITLVQKFTDENDGDEGLLGRFIIVIVLLYIELF